MPAFGGLLAPHWRDDARGVILGLSSYTSRAHIVRALLEAIAWQVYNVPCTTGCALVWSASERSLKAHVTGPLTAVKCTHLRILSISSWKAKNQSRLLTETLTSVACLCQATDWHGVVALKPQSMHCRRGRCWTRCSRTPSRRVSSCCESMEAPPRTICSCSCRQMLFRCTALIQGIFQKSCPQHH